MKAYLRPRNPMRRDVPQSRVKSATITIWSVGKTPQFGDMRTRVIHQFLFGKNVEVARHVGFRRVNRGIQQFRISSKNRPCQNMGIPYNHNLSPNAQWRCLSVCPIFRHTPIDLANCWPTSSSASSKRPQLSARWTNVEVHPPKESSPQQFGIPN